MGDSKNERFSVWDKLTEKYNTSRTGRIGRALLERLGFRPQTKESHEVEQTESDQEESEAEARRRIENEFAEEEAQRERKKLEEEMARARDYFDLHRDEVLRNQRAQELLERGLNERILKVDQLEEEVSVENPEVEKSTESYEGREIPVYTLHGFPMKMLTHTVDFRRSSIPGVIGTETYKAVMDDPSVWDTRRDIAEKAEGFGTRSSNARGDTISASYRNSEHNLSSRVEGELVYGFDHVDADSVVLISIRDRGTKNMAGTIETEIYDPDQIDILEGAQSSGSYNEILLRRYSENGMPKRPDYIVVEDGKITETVLKHAKYFNIPIINLDMAQYNERLKKHGEEVLESISEEDSYQEIDGKLAELLSNSFFKNSLNDLSDIGRADDVPTRARSALYGERCLEAEKLEFEKRIEFIAGTLQKYIAEIRAATSRGERAPEYPEGLRVFDASIIDVRDGKRRSVTGDSNYGFVMAPGNCSRIEIDMSLNGSSRVTETRIYDGEHPYDVETALKNGNLSQEKLDRADSSYYDRLLPLVEEYFAAMLENAKV